VLEGRPQIARLGRDNSQGDVVGGLLRIERAGHERDQTEEIFLHGLSRDTDYFGRAEQTWMVNFRVRDLAAMVAQLEAAGIAVTVDPEQYPNGRFARVYDPEGNPVELWGPSGG
jgi:catechol 2,3-dioxygenase-like lactoylglutathione lyase family enzyme